MNLSTDLTISVKWNGNEYKIEGIPCSATVSDFKSLICTKTGVLPDRQKLLGLKPGGKAVSNDEKLVDLKLKPSTKVMLIGTLEKDVVAANLVADDIPEVLNDFDIEEEVEMIENREEYLQKIEKRIKSYEFKILNEPRANSKLLVLDIDYTLFDHRSVAERGIELMRPYLHEFLTSAYNDNYDIVIWSATSMKWIEAKMDELGVSRNTNYKICFMVDSVAMITIHVESYGVIDVKPLGVIWGKFENRWSKKNTIMFDDLRRNFLMNPQSGLKIAPFKNAHTNRGTDKELKRLSKYLHCIANLDDFTILDHSHWEAFYRANYHKKKKKKEGDDLD